MAADTVRTLRQAELRRRVEALPAEIAAWRSRTEQVLDYNAHHSQLAAVQVMMETLLAEQSARLAAADAATPAGFLDAGYAVVRGIIQTQRIWDFFRDKFDLRMTDFGPILWIADTVAWNCHRSVMDAAVTAGIVAQNELREPPLTYLTAEFSPATWVRGSRPNDGRSYALGTAYLPIPVVQVPWDHVTNVWELLSLPHEVGHDIEADLKLRVPLTASLQAAFDAPSANVAPERRRRWLQWQGEVFADLVALQLVGPAFAASLMHLLLLPTPQVTQIDDGDPHPTHYPRILLNTAYARTLLRDPPPTVAPSTPAERAAWDAARGRVDADAAELEAAWESLYGAPSTFAAPNDFSSYVGDFPVVIRALMDTPLPTLKGQTVRSLMPFTAADDARIRAAVPYLQGGGAAPGASIEARHCLSAALLAVARVTADTQTSPQANSPAALAAALSAIHDRTCALIRAKTAPVLRGTTSQPHQNFIARLTRSLLAAQEQPAADDEPVLLPLD